MIQAIRNVEYSKMRLRALIDQLVAICLEIDVNIIEGLPRIQQEYNANREHLTKLSGKEVIL